MPIFFALALAMALAATGGSAAPPLHDAAWIAALKSGQTVTLPKGNYRGPWKVGTGVHLIALPGAILEGGNPVLTIDGDAVIIEGLSIRAAPDSVGIATADVSGLLLRNVSVSGGVRGAAFKRGSIAWQGGVIELSQKFGIWIKGSHANFSNLEFRHHQGPAIYLGHGSAILAELRISDVEYGLLAFGAQVDLSASRFANIHRAAVGSILTSGSISGLQLEGPFGEAALSLTGSRPFVLRGNHIRHAGSTGIKMINTVATLEGNVIEGARSDSTGLEGDGIYASNSYLQSSADHLLDNGGVGISISGGSAVFRDCIIEGTGQAAAAVTGQGALTLEGCHLLNGSTELIASPGSTLVNETVDR